MKRVGLRFEVLMNLLLLTAVAMFLLGFISYKITEGFVLKGRIDTVRSMAQSFAAVIAASGDPRRGAELLGTAMEDGAWGYVRYRGRETKLKGGGGAGEMTKANLLMQQAVREAKTVVRIEGLSLFPLSHYEGVHVAVPLFEGKAVAGALYLYDPLDSVVTAVSVGRKYIALWIIAVLVVIALFGSYLLSKRVVQPVHQLIKATSDIARGKPPSEENLGWVKEIHMLYLALNKMYLEIETKKAELEENIRALERANEELRTTQRQLIASEKLASAGVLAAGVAHEIGNPLSTIKGYVEVLRRRYGGGDDRTRRILDTMEDEVDRIDAIIRTLLDFSRPKSVEARETDLNDVVQRAAEIVRTQGILGDIDLVLDLSSKRPAAVIDPDQFVQVLINLVLNARDAIDGRGGTITLSTSATAEGNVRVVVRDTGCGIPAEVRNRIFDPFFTTKEPGKGTGLGLSVALRIVESFSGTITVDSTPGAGTEFAIEFPGAKRDAA